jgi:hypothetical protein
MFDMKVGCRGVVVRYYHLCAIKAWYFMTTEYLLWLYMLTAHHCQLLECLMTNKKNVVKDLLCVIAYGTSGARSSAAKLLFYYWPTFNPNLFDRRVVLQKFTSRYC